MLFAHAPVRSEGERRFDWLSTSSDGRLHECRRVTSVVIGDAYVVIGGDDFYSGNTKSKPASTDAVIRQLLSTLLDVVLSTQAGTTINQHVTKRPTRLV